MTMTDPWFSDNWELLALAYVLILLCLFFSADRTP